METDLPLDSESDIIKALSHYHSLWRIEESFRIQKSHLRIRPVYHYTKERIHAHIALCYMAFACLRQLEKRVYLQQKEQMSPETLRASMLDVRSALLRDKETGKLYRFPKRLSAGANKLYKSLGLKRDTKPREIILLRLTLNVREWPNENGREKSHRKMSGRKDPRTERVG